MNHSQNNQQKNNHTLSIQKAEVFSGPVPHPEIIEKYEKIYPGSAKQIFEEWDRQVTHRHFIEKSVVKTDNIKSILGVVFGFIVAMSAMVSGVIVWILKGVSLFAGGLSFSGLALLLFAFVGTKFKKENKKE